jgi:hypothetical protein
MKNTTRHPQVPVFRPLQDWANMPYRPVRGLRSDLRALLNKFLNSWSNALITILWISIIPCMTVMGLLAGY